MIRTVAPTERPGLTTIESLETRYVCAGWVAGLPSADSTFETAWRADARAAREQWQLSGRGQTVAVIDTGIAYDHPALGNGFGSGYRIVGGWDFTEENDADPYDDAPAGFHGTHVAGILGSQDRTYPGVAPDVDMVSLRVFNDRGDSDFRWIERALRWVYDHRSSFANPITTVNLSLGVAPQDAYAAAGILDDELTQLVESGIFVAVAAGNGFDRDGRAQLNYPASHPSVVPVGSGSPTGELSSFTRRDTRMLVSPGERITSTITDFLYDFNGRTDDFRAFSGTSQATPQIAGAAVLIREALQRAGHTQINQQSILDVLRKSADKITDLTTGQKYDRVNLGAALELALADDVPSRFESALGLGVITSRLRRTAKLESLRDQDFFLFQIGREGLLYINAHSATENGATVRLFVDGMEMSPRNGVPVSSSQQAVVCVEGGIPGFYDLIVDLDLVQDRGELTYQKLSLDVATAPIQRFQTQASGLLTVMVESTRNQALHVDLLDSQYRLVNEHRGDSAVIRWDQRVTAGETYFLRLSGESQVAHVTLANLVKFAGDRAAQIETPAGMDQLGVRLDEDVRVAVGSLEYRFSSLLFDKVAVTLNSNAKVSVATGRPADSLYLRHRQLEANDGRTLVLVDHRGQVEVSGRSGEGQQLRVYGSVGPDRFRSQAGLRTLVNSEANYFISAIDRVFVFGRGGDDLAQLFGTEIDDTLVAREDWARLATPISWDHAESFRRVDVYGGGGLDRAFMTGDSGDDTLVIKSQFATLASLRHLWYVESFEKISSQAGEGGVDRAYLHGSDADDILVARTDSTCLSGGGYVSTAVAFDRVYAFGDGGWDRAKLFGSELDDLLTMQVGLASLGAGENVRVAIDFDEIYAEDLGGIGDLITAPSFVSNDSLSADVLFRLAALGYSVKTRGFEQWRTRD